MKLFFTVLAAFLISNAHASGNPARIYMDQALGVQNPGTVCEMPATSVRLMGFLIGETPNPNEIPVFNDSVGGMNSTRDTIDPISGLMTVNPASGANGLVVNGATGARAVVVNGTSGVEAMAVIENGGGGAGNGLHVINFDPTQQANFVLESPLSGGGTGQVTFSDLGGSGEVMDIFVQGSGTNFTMGFFDDPKGTQPLTIDSPASSPGRIQTPWQQFQGQGVAPPVSDAGNGAIYFDTTSNLLMLSQNGGAYAQVSTGAPGADVHLSNLVAPTAIPVDLLPAGNLSNALGSNTNAWGTSYIEAMFNPAGTAAVFWDGTNFDPGTDGVINLGEGTNRWNNIHAANNVFTSTLVAGFWQDPTLTNQIGWSSGSLLPNSTDTVTLGGPSLEYKFLYVGQAVSTAGVQLSTSVAQPTCVVGLRGLQWIIQGGAGVADIYQICEKNAANAYVWVSH